MSTYRTYRVIVRSSQQFVIDIAARDEQTALFRAEKRWDGGDKKRFERVLGFQPVEFEIDEEASLRLAEVANEDRARWAEMALRAFSRETGSDMGRDALRDLLCNLGHYADELKLDFRDEVQRAAEAWAEEKAEGGTP